MNAEALAAAERLVREVCAEVGFTPPGEDATLAEWVGHVLDSPLAPRGGPAWGEAHAALVDAYEASLYGSRELVRDRLLAALAIVRSHGNHFCACSPRPPTLREPFAGRELCQRCALRQRPASPKV